MYPDSISHTPCCAHKHIPSFHCGLRFHPHFGCTPSVSVAGSAHIVCPFGSIVTVPSFLGPIDPKCQLSTVCASPIPNFRDWTGVGNEPFFSVLPCSSETIFKSSYPQNPSFGSFILSHPITHSSYKSPASRIRSASSPKALTKCPCR